MITQQVLPLLEYISRENIRVRIVTSSADLEIFIKELPIFEYNFSKLNSEHNTFFDMFHVVTDAPIIPAFVFVQGAGLVSLGEGEGFVLNVSPHSGICNLTRPRG